MKILRALIFLALLAALSSPVLAAPLDNDLLVRRGVYLYNHGRFQEAKDILDLVAEKPEYAPIRYFLLGRIYRQKDNEDTVKAIANFENVLTYSTSARLKMYAKIHLAYIYLKTPEMISKSIGLADQLLALNPEDPDVTYCYAMIYNRSGYMKMTSGKTPEHYLSAIPDFKKALKIRPKLYGIANNIVSCYARLAEPFAGNDAAKTCGYAKEAWEVLKPYFDRASTDAKLAANRDYLVKLCPELALERPVEPGETGSETPTP